MKYITVYLDESALSNKFDKTDIKGTFDYLKSIGFEENKVIDASSPLWMKLYKMKRDEEIIHVRVNCKLHTQDETSIESVTNSHGVSLIKRNKFIVK